MQFVKEGPIKKPRRFAIEGKGREYQFKNRN